MGGRVGRSSWAGGLVSGVLALVALLAAPASPAYGAFGPAVDLSAPGLRVVDPQLATNAAGDSIVVWKLDDVDAPRADQIQARRISSIGELGPVLNLHTAEGFVGQPDVGIDADGDATVVFGYQGAVNAMTVSADGAIGPVRTWSHPTNAVQIAVSPSGVSAVVWTESVPDRDLQVHGRMIAAAGGLGPERVLSEPDVTGRPRVGIDGDGDAIAVWERILGPDTVEMRRMSAVGVLDRTRALSRAGGHAALPDVASAADGNAVVSWYWTDSATDEIFAQARPVPPTGPPGRLRTLGRGGPPAIAMDPGGTAIALWTGNGGRARVRTVAPAGVLGETQILSAPGRAVGFLEIVRNASGQSLAVWARQRDTGSRLQVQARSVAPSGVLGPVSDIAVVGGTAQSFPGEGAASIDAAGRSTVVWSGRVGGSAPERIIRAVRN